MQWSSYHLPRSQTGRLATCVWDIHTRIPFCNVNTSLTELSEEEDFLQEIYSVRMFSPFSCQISEFLLLCQLVSNKGQLAKETHLFNLRWPQVCFLKEYKGNFFFFRFLNIFFLKQPSEAGWTQPNLVFISDSSLTGSMYTNVSSSISFLRRA